MNKGTVIAGLIFLVLVAGGTFALTSSNSDKTKNTSSSQTSTDSASSSENKAETSDDSTGSALTITYDGTSFTPDNVTVKSGDKITVKNASTSADLDFDSDPHPVHTDDTDLNAGNVEPGTSKSFTVTKKGSFGFHNHHDPTQHGNITIE